MAATVTAAQKLKTSGDDIIAGIAKDAKNLLLSQIEPDPGQPRVEFDKKAMAVLADDIRKRGVLQPILVSPPTEPDGKYRIIAGERRWRASIEAEKTRIPCLIRDMSEPERRSAQLVENIIREDLSDIEKGKALRALYELRKQEGAKITWEDIAQEVGIKRARINELFQLSELPAPITEMIQMGRLSGSHGILLFRAQDKLGEKGIIALATEAARKEDARPGSYAMSVSALRTEIQNQLTSEQPEPSKTTKVEHHSDTEPTYLQQTLEALRSGRVSAEYRQQLFEVLKGGGAQ